MGKIHNLLYFPHNYTESVAFIRDRSVRDDFDDEEVEAQEINIYRDVLGLFQFINVTH